MFNIKIYNSVLVTRTLFLCLLYNNYTKNTMKNIYNKTEIMERIDKIS